MKDTWILKAQWNSNKLNIKQNIPRHINSQTAENWKQGDILSSIQREKDGYFHKSTIRMLADFSIGMKKSNRQCIEEMGDTKYWKNVKYQTEFYIPNENILHTEKKNFRSQKIKPWNLLLPGVHYRKSKKFI